MLFRSHVHVDTEGFEEVILLRDIADEEELMTGIGEKPAQGIHDITEVAQRHSGPGQQSRTSQIGLGHEVTAYRLQ